MQKKLYHMGFRGNISRSTLADANETRDWRIYADFAQVLIHIARDFYRDEEFGVELDQTVYALDSTTIDLCLSLFPWAHFRKQKGAIKLHTLLDLHGTSKNAVKTHIWIAISVYVLVAIIKKRLNLDLSLYTILQILSVTVFEQIPIIQVLTPRSGLSSRF